MPTPQSSGTGPRHWATLIRSRGWDLLVGAAMLFVAAAVHQLLGVNRELRTELQELKRARGTVVAVGDPLPHIDLSTLSGVGTSTERMLAGKPRLIGFFDTTCRYCDDALTIWLGLSAEMEQLGVGVVLISLDEWNLAARYVASKAPFDGSLALAIDDPADARLLGIPAVPFTVFVDAEGIVRGVRRGLLSASQLADLVKSTSGSP